MKRVLFIVCLLLSGLLFAAPGTKHLSLRYGERRAELPEGAEDDRLLDLYLPTSPAPEKGYPCLVWIHGGGFSKGRRTTGYFAKELLARGYAVVAVEYYLHLKYNHATAEEKKAYPKGESWLWPEQPYPNILRKGVDAAAEDAEVALAWLAEHAKDYNLDVDRFALGGSSAGAITSLEVAYVRRKKTGVNLRAVLDVCGAVEHLETFRAPAPWLVTGHGDSDKIVNVGYAHALKKRMDELSVPNRVFIMPGVGHFVADAFKKAHCEEALDFLDEAMKIK